MVDGDVSDVSVNSGSVVEGSEPADTKDEEEDEVELPGGTEAINDAPKQ